VQHGTGAGTVAPSQTRAQQQLRWATMATKDMGRKEGVLCPLGEGGAEYASNTMLSGPRSTFVPSGIFIHPAVWPQ